MTLQPTYGRDYKSKKEVLEAFNSGKDFLVADLFSQHSGKPANIESLVNANIHLVTIRYNGNRSVIVHKF